MSLVLNIKPTVPPNLEARFNSFPDPDVVRIGDYRISLEDFLVLAGYVLTNTNLEKNDPRLQFVKCIQKMKVVQGYGKRGERLESPEVPV